MTSTQPAATPQVAHPEAESGSPPFREDRAASPSLICFTDRAGCLTKLRPGDLLALDRPDGTTMLVYDRVVAEHRYLGSLASAISFDPEFTAAYVDNPLLGTIRVVFYPQEPCGCIRNLGNHLVHRCRAHPFDPSTARNVSREGYGDRGVSDDPTREQDQILRETS